jgi:uncharacterized protein (DUF2141 family)
MRWLAALTVLCLAAPAAAEPAEHGELVVLVSGVRSTRGSVRIKVHHHDRDFPASKDVIARKLVPADSATVSFAFSALPHGTYAVVSSLDRGLLGRPVEGLGFSNGARVRFGPPSFADAAFELRTSRLELTIEVAY